MASPLRNVTDLVEAVRGVEGRWGIDAWWRGHRSCLWKLIPSVFRDPSVGPDYEKTVAIRFMQRARTRYPNCPRDDAPFSRWLFLMQHYRLPTRLLDWSESPLAATYFAVAHDDDEQGALWALNPFKLNMKEIDVDGLVPAQHPAVVPFVNGILTGANPGRTPTAALITDEIDLRMMMQLSAFTIHVSPGALEEKAGSEEFLMKFEIPAEAKRSLRIDLQLLGIRETTLFPDLEHLANEVARIRPTTPR